MLDTVVGGNNVVGAFTGDDIIYSVYIMYIKNILEGVMKVELQQSNVDNFLA